MYGKTLADFPGRIDSFREALGSLSDAQLNFAFNEALKTMTEFPVPAQIRTMAEQMPVKSGSYQRMLEVYKEKHRAELSQKASD